MSITVKRINSADDFFHKFCCFSETVYKDDTCYTPIAAEIFENNLLQSSFSERQALFLAVNDLGEPLARMVGRITSDFNSPDGKSLGLIGFFEALNNQEAAESIFKEAVKWFREQNIDRIIGPMDEDIWHACLMNKGPFDGTSFLMEPYNPDYYPELWENFGFRKISSYSTKQVDELKPLVKTLKEFKTFLKEKKYKLRPLNMNCFSEELKLMYDLFNQTYCQSFMYIKPSMEDFISFFEEIQPIIDPELIIFAQDQSGENIAFLVALPDYYEAIKSMKGKQSLMAKVKFLVNLGKANTVNIKDFGIKVEHRHTGLFQAIMHRIYYKAMKKGFKKVNMCFIPAGNPMEKMDAGTGTILRNYCLYELEI